jgi:Transcriptional regulator, AbiEi antitoxin
MPKCADMRALGEFAACHYGTFNLTQAAANGISPSVIGRMERDGVIVKVRKGIYRFAGWEPDWRAVLYAACLGLRAAVSHFSAAALHRLDGFTTAPEKPELICHHFDPVDVPGATVRRTRWLPKKDTTIVDGIACTTIERTILDLAAVLPHHRLVELIDAAQRRGVKMDDILARAEKLRKRGRPGIREVMEIVRRRMNGYHVPESVFERLLARCLRSPLLTDIVRQHELRTPSGLFVARFDFAVPWVRLGIEGHSRSFHLGENVERYDEDRDIRASQEGWEITYLGFAATKEPALVCRDIELIVARRAADLSLKPPA